MSEPTEELLAQTTNKKHSPCPNKDALEQNYVYTMEVIQRQHSEHVIRLQRQHKDHIKDVFVVFDKSQKGNSVFMKIWYHR